MRRASARVMDFFPVVVVGTALNLWIAGAHGRECLTHGCQQSTPALLLATLGTLALAAWLELRRITRTGTTFGKEAAGIEIANITDGTPPSMEASLLRWAIPTILSLFLCIALAALLVYGNIAHGDVVLLGVVYWTSTGCGTLGWLTLHLLTAVNDTGRGLADRLAGTVVVESAPPKQGQPEAPPQQAQH